MQKNLVIVESPAKARTIEKFLGKEFKVMSSYGHIRDLKTHEFSVDVAHNYAPSYVVPEDKKKIVSELAKEAKVAETVWLASDEDREGEAISWHLAEVLKLSPDKTRRIVFHEITKSAILHAIETPRAIDLHLVDAQQARRVLDRIVGFELSPVLWKKVKPSLSAGRVQSVAVRLIAEREREIAAFVSESAFRIVADFILPDGTTLLKAELNRRIKSNEETLRLLNLCKDAAFRITDISVKPAKKSPAPPFTTSTLQQEAARKLGYSVSQTMRVAQQLYEAGTITYMRTDSVNLSDLALATTKEAILNTYGDKYYHFRKFTTKTKGAQEAHEAIRPTDIRRTNINATPQEQKLYDLIRKRTLACQMADAALERTSIAITAPTLPNEQFSALGEVIVFDGFLQVYYESSDDDNDNEKEQENGLLPPVKANDPLALKTLTATERFSQRPPRYTEASLVKRLEELGIGRPSTYAPTIQTIQNRGYVLRGDTEGSERNFTVIALNNGQITETTKKERTGADRKKLLPTDIGLVVNDFLMQHFPQVMDYNFTANVEQEFDKIAEGATQWTDAIHRFYTVFHPIVLQTANTSTQRTTGERKLGIDPTTQLPVFARIGRFGSVVQLGEAHSNNPKAPKPQFAPLLKGQSIETLTLQQALQLFQLPKQLGLYEGQPVILGNGRFGAYIKYDNQYINIPPSVDPLALTLQQALELIADKQQQQQQRTLKTFPDNPDIQIINGRYGPYITNKGNNYKIPKTISDPNTLTLQQVLDIIASTPPSRSKPRHKFPRSPRK